MLKKKTIFFLTLFLILLFSSGSIVFAGSQDNWKTRAVQLFNENKFTEAEPVFRQLLERKSEEPILSYYYGASPNRKRALYKGRS